MGAASRQRGRLPVHPTSHSTRHVRVDFLHGRLIGPLAPLSRLRRQLRPVRGGLPVPRLRRVAGGGHGRRWLGDVDAATVRDRDADGIHRYAEFLPFTRETAVSIDEGATPGVSCPDLADDLNVGELLIRTRDAIRRARRSTADSRWPSQPPFSGVPPTSPCRRPATAGSRPRPTPAAPASTRTRSSRRAVRSSTRRWSTFTAEI